MKIIDTLCQCSLLKTNIKELNEQLTSYLKMYSKVLENNKLKRMIQIIYKINNYLNSNTGKKETSNFDIRAIENVLNLKNNSLYFTDLLMAIYEANLKSDEELNIFNSQEVYLLNHILDLNLSLTSLPNEFEKALKNLNNYEKDLKQIIQSGVFLTRLDDTFTFLKDLVDLFSVNIEKEKKLRKDFLNYFNFESNDKSDCDLLKILLTSICAINKKFARKVTEKISVPENLKPSINDKTEAKTFKGNPGRIETGKDMIKEKLIKVIPNKENVKPMNFINNKYKL
jgi:hypothetical protein